VLSKYTVLCVILQRLEIRLNFNKTKVHSPDREMHVKSSFFVHSKDFERIHNFHVNCVEKTMQLKLLFRTYLPITEY
jgi:hypothetical protein